MHQFIIEFDSMLWFVLIAFIIKCSYLLHCHFIYFFDIFFHFDKTIHSNLILNFFLFKTNIYYNWFKDLVHLHPRIGLNLSYLIRLSAFVNFFLYFFASLEYFVFFLCYFISLTTPFSVYVVIFSKMPIYSSADLLFISYCSSIRQ